MCLNEIYDLFRSAPENPPSTGARGRGLHTVANEQCSSALHRERGKGRTKRAGSSPTATSFAHCLRREPLGLQTRRLAWKESRRLRHCDNTDLQRLPIWQPLRLAWALPNTCVRTRSKVARLPRMVPPNTLIATPRPRPVVGPPIALLPALAFQTASVALHFLLLGSLLPPLSHSSTPSREGRARVLSGLVLPVGQGSASIWRFR